jgi:NAD(P)H-dependent FMN reductase
MAAISVQIIVGSTRQGRYGDKPAHWLYGILQQKEGIAAELIDLRDWPLPFFNDPVSPSKAKGNYANPDARRWAQKVAGADAYIFVVPEYNHGYPAVLKNALDWIYQEWNNKPVGFVSYGNVGGARSVEQLREVAVELQMIPIRYAVHIPGDVYRATTKQPLPVDPGLFEPVRDRADAMITQLVGMAKTLRSGRQEAARGTPAGAA